MTFHREPLGQKQPKPSKAAGRRHMARVAALPCVCCGYWPVTVHHVICGRFSQAKESDLRVIPLCHHHHQGADGIHTRRAWWVETFGPDTDYLSVVADALAGEQTEIWE